MKKNIFNIVVIILVMVIFFFLSINFIFRIPYGNGYATITYIVGFVVAIVAGQIAVALLFAFNRDNKNKK